MQRFNLRARREDRVGARRTLVTKAAFRPPADFLLWLSERLAQARNAYTAFKGHDSLRFTLGDTAGEHASVRIGYRLNSGFANDIEWEHFDSNSDLPSRGWTGGCTTSMIGWNRGP